LDTELYGETNEKDSWGPRSSLADLSISGQLREVAKPEEFRLVLNLTDYRVNQDLSKNPVETLLSVTLRSTVIPMV